MNTAPQGFKALATLLNETAKLIEVAASNDKSAFRARAYAGAATALERHAASASFGEVVAGGFSGIAGIGRGLQAELNKLYATGTLGTHEELLQVVPAGVRELLQVRGLGPKKVRALWLAGIDSPLSLLAAAESGELAALKGFGKKGAANLREAAIFLLEARSRVLRSVALAFFQEMEAHLPATPAGDLARGRDTLAALELQAAGEPEAWREALQDSPHFVFSEIKNGALSGTWRDFPICISAATAPRFALHDEPEHAGLTLPPPEALLQIGDIRGLLHTHSVWSDGENSVPDMLRATLALGHEYLGTADHSLSSYQARGLSLPRLAQAMAEVRQMQADGLPVLFGMEVDILPDGSLDYPDEILAQFDYVVASVHSGFSLSQSEQTARMVRAVSNPFVNILGHPSGRVLLRRPAYEYDVDEVLSACAAHDTAAEINASPRRLDLRWQDALRWRGRVKFSVNTDAHSVAGLSNLHFGVTVAQKAGLRPEDVINTLPLDSLRRWARPQR